MKQHKLNIVVYREDEYYVAQCLDVDVASFGKTEKEALKNIQEALELYFEDSSGSEISHVSSPKVISLQLQHA